MAPSPIQNGWQIATRGFFGPQIWIRAGFRLSEPADEYLVFDLSPLSAIHLINFQTSVLNYIISSYTQHNSPQPFPTSLHQRKHAPPLHPHISRSCSLPLPLPLHLHLHYYSLRPRSSFFALLRPLPPRPPPSQTSTGRPPRRGPPRRRPRGCSPDPSSTPTPQR